MKGRDLYRMMVRVGAAYSSDKSPPWSELTKRERRYFNVLAVGLEPARPERKPGLHQPFGHAFARAIAERATA